MTGAAIGAFTGRSAADAEVIIAKAAAEPNITRIVSSIGSLEIWVDVRGGTTGSTSAAETQCRIEFTAIRVIQVKVPSQ